MQVLKSYDWSRIDKAAPKPRSANYPWQTWFDGKIRLLEAGKDFDGPAASIERVIRTSATRKKISVKVRTLADGNVVLQSASAYLNGSAPEKPAAKAEKAPAKATPKKAAPAAKKAPSKSDLSPERVASIKKGVDQAKAGKVAPAKKAPVAKKPVAPKAAVSKRPSKKVAAPV